MIKVSEKSSTLVNGRQLKLYEISNSEISFCILNYGATITQILIPDKYGNNIDVVLGFDDIGDYLSEHPCFGSTVGRYANRIENASFKLNNKIYKLSANEGTNQLHGGVSGFDKKMWKVKAIDAGVELHLFSPDGDEGFPGNMNITVSFTLTEKNEIVINYKAVSDADTYCNLTNHSYFNLEGKGNALNHKLRINADHFLPVNNSMIPEHRSQVKNSIFDFRNAREIFEGIDSVQKNNQIDLCHGYDHCYILNSPDLDKSSCLLQSDESGIQMEVYTNKPGVQLYTANHLNGEIKGKNNKKYGKYSAVCLETQFFPNSPNCLEYPSSILKKGKEYNYTTVYKFKS